MLKSVVFACDKHNPSSSYILLLLLYFLILRQPKKHAQMFHLLSKLLSQQLEYYLLNSLIDGLYSPTVQHLPLLLELQICLRYVTYALQMKYMLIYCIPKYQTHLVSFSN